jgi:phosphoribosylformylglycinamidine cyclo-ligase
MSEAYAQAGVHIAQGNAAVERMRQHVAKTMRPEVIGGIGGFGGLYSLASACRAQSHPVLVAGADGVGTKLNVAVAMQRHDTIGIDCVAMCANDVLVQGAEPLFFLDYIAVGVLDAQHVESIVAGVAEGCVQAGCALLGGETAEMPGMYADGAYDIAGFCVGIVDQAHIIDGSRVRSGDVLIGVSSTGLHSNGFALVRHRLAQARVSYDDVCFGNTTWGEVLLTPTRIYVRPILTVLREMRDAVHGMAHITGGGLLENVPRMLPHNTAARIDVSCWSVPPVFAQLQGLDAPPLTDDDMYRTWNMGIGFVLAVDAQRAADVCATLAHCGERASVIGTVEEGNAGVVLERLHR